MTFSLIPLLFEYEDFDGLIAPRVMRWHRESVHAQYMDAINALLAPLPQFSEKSIEEILSHPELLPAILAALNSSGRSSHNAHWT
jgi:superoxide dismutase